MAVVQDIDNESQYLARAVDRKRLPPETVAYVAVPIIWDDQTVGVLTTHRLRNRPRPFQADLQILKIIASMIGQMLRINELVRERTAHLEQEKLSLISAYSSPCQSFRIIGNSPALKIVIDQAIKVAASSATIMLTSESGTGKERFALMLHQMSGRRDKAFICINCAAIPENLLEAELFGYEKGAFTGASKKKQGKIELAHHGTLFLDEIGDMSFDLQAKLLRLLQERSFQRVGGTVDIEVDIRVITATHIDLNQAVKDKKFRLDLYYRLNVILLKLPPLRERVGTEDGHKILKALRRVQGE